jgi:hypothetical protein
MNEAILASRKHIGALARELGLQFVTLGTALNKARHKDVVGQRIGFYKPRYVKVGDEWKQARKVDGNVSYTIVNPMSISRKVSQSKLRKYHSLRRAIHACERVDSIEITFGLSKEDKLFLKRQAKAAKYAFK